MNGRIRKAPPLLPALAGAAFLLLSPCAGTCDAKTVLGDAEKAMGTPVLSVTRSPVKAPSGDPHDYVTLSTYAWPDPASADGLPYIMRDGQTNPETNAYPDRSNLTLLITSVRHLVSGYLLTHDSRYADKAVSLLSAWFLDSDTKMNPNLEYAQIVPGRNQEHGNPSGLIETHDFPDLIESLETLENTFSVSQKFRDGMRAWFREYLHWLQNSKIGRKGTNFSNNQLTWYTAQQVAICGYLGDSGTARMLLTQFMATRLPEQIRQDGAQPEELKRTKSFNYSLVNLLALFRLAKLGQPLGVDMWHYTPPHGAGIGQALDYLIPYATGEQRWPYQEIQPYDISMMKSLLNTAMQAYPEKRTRYESALKTVKAF